MNERGMTASELIKALTLFVEKHGDLPILTADWDTVGDLDLLGPEFTESDLSYCQFGYKDLNRLPLRPYAFEESPPALSIHVTDRASGKGKMGGS